MEEPKKVKWHIHCTLHDKNVGFGIWCYACKDCKMPDNLPFFPTDLRLCIYQKHIEEN